MTTPVVGVRRPRIQCLRQSRASRTANPAAEEVAGVKVAVNAVCASGLHLGFLHVFYKRFASLEGIGFLWWRPGGRRSYRALLRSGLHRHVRRHRAVSLGALQSTLQCRLHRDFSESRQCCFLIVCWPSTIPLSIRWCGHLPMNKMSTCWFVYPFSLMHQSQGRFRTPCFRMERFS